MNSTLDQYRGNPAFDETIKSGNAFSDVDLTKPFRNDSILSQAKKIRQSTLPVLESTSNKTTDQINAVNKSVTETKPDYLKFALFGVIAYFLIFG